jgi:TPR repeat protein
MNKTKLEDLLNSFKEADSFAQHTLENLYFDGMRNSDDALRWYRIAAEHGELEASRFLGFMCEEGKGSPQDYVEALKWFRLAAEKGHPGAQYNLGLMCEKGKETPQNYEEAAKWYRIAAENGHHEATTLLNHVD